MDLPRFASMLALVLLVFATSAYTLSGSIWKAFVAAVLAAVAIQVCYLCVVLFMASRERPSRKRAQGETASAPRTNSTRLPLE